MYHPRHARPHRYAVAAAVAALVIVIAGLVFGLGEQQDETAAPGGPNTTAATPSQDAASDDAVPAASKGPSALDRCQMQYEAQAPVLHAAARSLKQWQVHVEAMNQLVAGEITPDQASDFWSRTRMGAKGRVADFREADDGFAAEIHRCPAPQAVDATQAVDCARSVALRDQVVVVARRAIDTWAMHVRDMELLRNGQLSPARATRMWMMNWRAGQRQIDDYHEALRDADRTDPCAA